MVDKDDNVYIASTTFSTDFPTLNAYQSTFGGMQDGVVCKFNPTLNTLLWSTYAGGNSKDAAYSIDVDKNGFAYVTGGTCSPTMNFPAGGFMSNRMLGGNNTVDAFVLKLSQLNGALQAGTYFGSTEYDQAHFVRVNDAGNVFIFGQTTAPGNTLIYNAIYNNPNSGQFLASFSNDLSSLNWSTVFGSGSGQPNISPTAFEVDICNRIYLAGVGREWPEPTGWYFNSALGYYEYDLGWLGIQGTKNMDITADAYQSNTDGKDFYILVMDDEAKNLDYATYFGEIHDGRIVSYDGINTTFLGCRPSGRDHVDGGTSRFDTKGYVYQSVCASCGGCNGFPTAPKPGAWSVNNNSTNCNNAVMRFFIDFGLLIADFDLPVINCDTKKLQFTNTTQIHYNNPHIKYTWDFGDGSRTSNEFEPSHEYLSPGEYTIKLVAQDSSACNLADSITKKLLIENSISYETLETKNICQGDTVLIGISTPYDSLAVYEWSPIIGLADPTQPQTTAYPESTTIYTLTVTKGWCQTVYVQTVEVYENDYNITDIEVSVNGDVKNPICRGEKARLTAVTSAPTQQYLWSTSRTFIPLINIDLSKDYIEVSPFDTTTYYLKVLSAYCDFEDIDSVTVEVSYNKIHATGDTLICKGEVVEIQVENLTPAKPLTYSWFPKYAISVGDDTDKPLVNPEKTTNFIVYATNEDGCRLTDTVSVKVDELIIGTLVNNPISCFGKTDAAIDISPNGIEPYTYLWENGDVVSTRINLMAGNYEVTVSDSLGCSNTRIFKIVEPPLLEISDTSIAFMTCEDACNGKISVTVIGGTLPYIYNWSNGDSLAKANNLCEGSYALSIIDAHGCTASLPAPITIGIHENLPKLDAYADSYVLFKGQSTNLHALKNPIDTIQYLWFPNLWIENYTKAVATITPDDSFTYYVKATDSYGCSSVDTVPVVVHDWICADPYIFVPTAFTPNKDGKNDVLKVESGVISKLQFSVYDRWGEKVFETTDMNQFWDGTYLGKPLQPQVLVYYINATCINQQTFNQKGNITLIR